MCTTKRHFLNSMKPVNQIFLFRSNIDFGNERINQNNLQDIQASTHHAPGQDKCGRVTIKKTKKYIPQIGAHKESVRMPADSKKDDTNTFKDRELPSSLPAMNFSHPHTDSISLSPVVEPTNYPSSQTLSQMCNASPDTDDSASVCSHDMIFDDFPSSPSDFPYESNTTPEVVPDLVFICQNYHQ